MANDSPLKWTTLSDNGSASFKSSGLGIPQPSPPPSYQSETYAISKVCFSVSILTTLGHTFMAGLIRRIRVMYGIYLLTTFGMTLVAYVLTLAMCSIGPNSSANEALSLSAHIAFLSVVAWLFVSVGQNWYVVYRGCHDTSTYRLCYWVHYAWASLVAFAVPTGFILSGLLFPEHHAGAENRSTNHQMKNPREVVCGVGSTPGHLYLFFLPIFTLLSLSVGFLLATHKMHSSSREDRQMISRDREVSARFWMTWKLTSTYFLIWITAFLATHLEYAALWHIFTMCCSLQSIFVTVNFTFSRPVLDILHQLQDDKDDSMMDNRLIYTSLPPSPLANRTNSMV